ncbi:sigma-70 family RNA polymerase sigma factor [Aestuariirhabdus sp. Z084]|uniref:sigma-70 family RNA polymerase sigma factor n=1 Tax=Aestuariirhabdus haliotis TaxID=2918751 RepID=UPI00201B3C1E|nr:sigma-70 family RNA polymerase sigma factor [Aestuariirhabdus haliotis]MCL6416043.1 sigma-70 family RNA polymerase sigma factor [Aestuariirhabdus haliotis]MCL6419389.1 sigma-70 family RNA polymerase sigma factor [Aestuariirhabdus haliotis]
MSFKKADDETIMSVVSIHRDSPSAMNTDELQNDKDSWSQLLSQVGKHQDREAFVKLFQHFAPMIKSYFLSLGKGISPELADDMVQEAMIKVWDKAGMYDPERAAASTWIYTIARNARIDLLRRKGRHSVEESIGADDVWPDSDQTQPLAQLTQVRSVERVNQAFKSLPNEQANILAMVYREGKCHSEIAAELELPLGTVKSRIRLALAKLNTHFTRSPL